jgi:hypothetical protein
MGLTLIPDTLTPFKRESRSIVRVFVTSWLADDPSATLSDTLKSVWRADMAKKGGRVSAGGNSGFLAEGE